VSALANEYPAYPAGVAQTQDLERIEAPPGPLWQRIRSEPERAAELIALAAAERFHEPARRWASITLPYNEPARAARLTAKKHVRMARLEGATLGIGGMLTAPADIMALLWLQSRMVFYIAASYGYDPAHPMRPAELLVLMDVYPTAEEARAALDGVGKPLPSQMIDNQLRKAGDTQLVNKLLMYAGRKVVKRLGGKLVPIISSPISAIQNGAATRELAERAVRYYGG
jgi:EcsC protein family